MNTTDFNLLLEEGQLLSLSKGKVPSKKQFGVFNLLIAIFCFFPIITLVLVFLPEVTWNSEMIAVAIVANVFSAAIITCVECIKLKNKKIVEQVKLWLNDAVKVVAETETIGKQFVALPNTIIVALPNAISEIQVRFTVNGKNHRKISTVGSGATKGYSSLFNKYADKKVTVLYSQQYDEVLLVDDVNDPVV